ncbi:ABC transporter ATP-binding protein [Pigmentibacter sp. JX0631]|uniref:ABC transporter ATP-binding protein n=1 Tax=Pigmentibacter sp. JX0631 TaxID=2976982 RepID=UPI00246845EB|nr:ABC transporter ATP-binding protein [Pigmentibacter sp. JX0631]WGL60949.1 ABC transporter ATP-binding protein [Pigmentibacter sp. JX0631]
MLTKNNLFKKIFFMRFRYKLIIFLLSLISSLFSLLVPFYQKELIDYLNLIREFSVNYQYLKYILFIFVFSFISQIFLYFAKYVALKEGSFLQTWLSNFTYAKALRIKSDADNKISVGESLSIYATDIQTSVTFIDDIFPNFISYLIPVMLAPFAIYFITGLNPLIIFSIVGGILAINITLGLKQGRLFFKNKFYSSLRIGVVSEWILNIRIIRMLGWTEGIEKKIKVYRELETLNRISMVRNAAVINSIGYSSPFIINIFSIYLLYKVDPASFTAGKIFSLFWLFSVLLTRPMRMIPIMFVSITDSFTSIRRIQNFWEQELEEYESKLPSFEYSSFFIRIKELYYIKENKILLENISLDIKSNEFVAIIGEFGSGKSLIIQALLNLIKTNYKEFTINNRSLNDISLSELRSYFSYVPQDFFVINSNLRDNVAFEFNYTSTNDERVNNCLELSQFKHENEQFLLGLESNIGERGINLSGGQKQRISLARACYSERPIILLDDCLSALDVNTQEKVINELLNGYWKNKIRILVTHKLSVLNSCDRVIFIKNGKIVENGNFRELIKNSQDVRNFLSNIVLQE